MPHIDGRSRHRHSVTFDKEYLIFLCPIPRNYRWQEIKDIAKKYGVEHVRQTFTVDPGNEIGYLIITSLEAAKKAFVQFHTKGVGDEVPKLRVTLNGPFNRDEIREPNLLCDARILMSGNREKNPMLPKNLATNTPSVVNRHRAEVVPQYRGHGPSLSVPAASTNRHVPVPASFSYAMTPERHTILHSRHNSYHQSAADTSPAVGRRGSEARPSNANSEMKPFNPNGTRQRCSATRSQDRGKPSRAIRITYLPISYLKKDVNTLLQKFGRIEAASLSFDTVSGIGIAQAVFKSSRDSLRAMEGLNHKFIDHNNQLSVTYDAAYAEKFRSPSASENGDGSSEQEQTRRRGGFGTVAVVPINGAIGSSHKRPSKEDESEESTDEAQGPRRSHHDARGTRRHNDRHNVR